MDGNWDSLKIAKISQGAPNCVSRAFKHVCSTLSKYLKATPCLSLRVLLFRLPKEGSVRDTFSEPRDTFSAQLGSAPPPMSPRRQSREGGSYEPPLLDWVSLEVWVILSVLQ